MPREKMVRMQLGMLKPILNGMSLESSRKSQELIGGIMSARFKDRVIFTPCTVSGRNCAWALPFDEKREGVIVYFHGGGYCFGDLETAKGFGSMLAANCAMRVFCCNYRLAPEDPFPAALDDCVSFVKFLFSCGYGADKMFFCGESAGGGLVYSVCMKLRELSLPLPAGLISISPWTDLTQSGDSYEKNLRADPNMTKEGLQFFADSYTSDPLDPLASPLFGVLEGLPPSLIFVGSSEIMLDDAVRMHEKLLASGCRSTLYVGKDLWHAYVLYDLKEHRDEDMARINSFLDSVAPPKRKLRWMRLDNAGKIYPAARTREWSSLFRLSFDLSEPVDPVFLQSALDVTVRRFPSIAVRLRRGFFWYYLEELRHAPRVAQDTYRPLYRMPFDDLKNCAFRVLYYKNRIAVEFFHALTDGTGGLVFLKTLVAEYLVQKYSVDVPSLNGVADRLSEPDPAELEDSFLKYAGKKALSRNEPAVYRFEGLEREESQIRLITGTLDAGQLKKRASEHGATVTAYLAASMLRSLCEVQKKHVPPSRFKPVNVQIPVNLRRFFPSPTVRNFSYFINAPIDPTLGSMTFDEIVKEVSCRMGLELNARSLRARFTPNVRSEKNFFLKITPLFIKDPVMKAVFRFVGQRTASLCMSNLGVVSLPGKMGEYVQSADFILGAEKGAPYNCSVITYENKVRICVTRKLVDPELEREFFRFLVKDGLKVRIESANEEEDD
ncbi:MAG: alpha/beta hydrolase fold domain-containing protein [Clostridia bacterium]|nr:alpha/beta hydrolase fold domain-containing protein [Clostridia bacterium]